jgi:hypothetical protein
MPDNITRLLQEDHPVDGNYRQPEPLESAPSYDSPLHQNDAAFVAQQQATPTANLTTEAPPAYAAATAPPAEPDELPDYEGATSSSTAALHVFEFRQHNRKHVTISEIPAPGSTDPGVVYTLRARSGPSLFSKKPEFTLLRERSGAGRNASVASTRSARSTRSQNAGADAEAGEVLATLGFDEKGPLPYMPRAWVALAGDRDAARDPATVRVEAPNFSDWRPSPPAAAALFPRGPVRWALHTAVDGLVTLDLVAPGGGARLARFTFSQVGALATDGALMGRLVFPMGGAALAACGGRFDLMLAGFLVAIKNFARMGRYHRNKAGVPGGDMGTEENWRAENFRAMGDEVQFTSHVRGGAGGDLWRAL